MDFTRSQRADLTRDTQNLEPMRVLELELSQPIPVVSITSTIPPYLTFRHPERNVVKSKDAGSFCAAHNVRAASSQEVIQWLPSERNAEQSVRSQSTDAGARYTINPTREPLQEQEQKIYRRAKILVRLHGCPLGFEELDLRGGMVSAEALAAWLWSKFQAQINQHLAQDGILPANAIPLEGISTPEQPGCLSERQVIYQNAPFVSIIIATHERAASLAAMLDSLLALEYPDFEIILVDNAPKTNETLNFFNQNQFKCALQDVSLRYVREEIPGLAVAHNRGLQEAKGSIIAFTDDDVVVDKFWLVEIVRGFRAARNVGCVTGLIIPSELQTPAQLLFEQFGGFARGFLQRIFDMAENRPPNPLFPYTAGRFGSGANMAFDVKALTAIGGFDPALGAGTPAKGADDLASFFATVTHGFKLVYQPSAISFHQHRRSYTELRRQMAGYGVGLTAFLTKCILDDPRRVFEMTTKLIRGVSYAFSPKSEKNQQKSIDYPHELERIERKGMLSGPTAYLYSRWCYRNAHAKDKLRNSIDHTRWMSPDPSRQPEE